jgi:hypothetical protein
MGVTGKREIMRITTIFYFLFWHVADYGRANTH